MRALALNCGSSSLKFALVETDDGERLLSGAEEIAAGGHEAALDAVVERLGSQPELAQGLEGIGHRVVHGWTQRAGLEGCTCPLAGRRSGGRW